MTNIRIDANDMRAILDYARQRIQQEESALNALDAAIGDGDHGITMRVGLQAVQAALAVSPQDASLSEVLIEAGKAFMGGTGGAIGVIFGRMLSAGGNALTNINGMGPAELKIMLNGMETGVARAGKARPGDKTLLDSLHAACESLKSSPTSESLSEAISRAACAAEEGAERTAGMHCRLGRASRLGDRALGHRDPGAVSFSLVLRSMAVWVKGKDREAVPN
jgi:dihydroxyacetone kinase phosphoprotein-dependent L subunit